MISVNVREAIDRKYPEWIFQLVTVDGDGNPNAMPAGWCAFCSGDPVMLAVSVAFERYTHDLMEDSEGFVLAFPSKKQKEAVYYCGTNSGRDVDKFQETDMETAPSEVVEAPLIEGSVACYECEKKGSLDTGDHTLYAGEVVAAHVSEDHDEKIYVTSNWYQKGAEGFKTVEEIAKS
ncbi:MAG: flavin reductase family protein [Candidatus Acetothermia bacterium]